MEFLLGMDLESLVRAVGLLGLFGIIFAESGVLLGLFLPGDSLLFTAGLLASQGYANILLLMAVTFSGAVLGDSFGYALGRRAGPKIFRKDDSLFFRRTYLDKASDFYKKHGGMTVVLARFIPMVRTFAPILAGVGRMHYPTFLFYNVFGALLWAVGLTGLGFSFGNVIPDAGRYLPPAVAVLIAISFVPALIRLWGDKKARTYLKDLWRKMLKSNQDPGL